jgi:1,4-alpha-glucan branching enzyme
MKARGELALVLHTHMPYVEGFGTWPFGEEWLWEAIATSYLPLLGVLGRAPMTLSLTPVLCDQLEAPGALERCLTFLNDIRPESHRRDIAALNDPTLTAELERSAAEYASAAARLESLGGGSGAGLLAELGRHATWTSAASHAVLPLVATETGVSVQVETGIASHRRRFGDWDGGFWLPECAHTPWLGQALADAGVLATCVELTRVYGSGAPEHLRPLASDGGPILWPVDRETMALVWSADGYPAHGAYRDYHALTPHHHRVWRNDGAPYDHAAAMALAREHAADFVARALARVSQGGICVCALDTELLGHWWYEGVEWLSGVVEESARQGLSLTTLDDAFDRYEPRPAPADLGVTSWGEGGDLRTWSGPDVADLAWLARSAELEALSGEARPSERATRELLALQASDWAFMASRRLAGDYPRQRARGHAEALARALNGGASMDPRVRNLAPDLVGPVG